MSPSTTTSLGVDSPPQRIRDRLAGQQILITGSTGFLAKAFVEKLLRSVDTVGGLHLLVRARPDGVSPRERVWKEVLRSRIYDRLRASLGNGFARLCDEKIHVVGGDLTRRRLGLDASTYRALTERITLVVNSAATVTFDERLDEAVELNTLGPSRLLQFARDCGDAPFMHVSTCYVCGVRKGVVVEDFSAPESARESLPRRKDDGAFDLDAIVAAMIGEAEELRLRFGADAETCRRRLIDSGMHWARSHGWNDTYTFTKWVGEQLLVRDRGKVPLVIFRPAIIEGSFDEPTPGWIDGLRMADPIIVAYGRGKLNEFPGRENIAIDLIPVDFVANAMIAALPAGLSRDPISTASDTEPPISTASGNERSSEPQAPARGQPEPGVPARRELAVHPGPGAPATGVASPLVGDADQSVGRALPADQSEPGAPATGGLAEPGASATGVASPLVGDADQSVGRALPADQSEPQAPARGQSEHQAPATGGPSDQSVESRRAGNTTHHPPDRRGSEITSATATQRASKPTGLSVFQCASSDRNPFVVRQLRRALEHAFQQRPMSDDNGRPIHPGPLRLVDRELFIRRWEARQQSVARYRRWLRRLGFSDRRLRRLSAAARQIEQLVYFAKIYSPYTHLDCRFADDELRNLAERMHPDDRSLFPFDPRAIDWDDYIINRHIPGLLSFVLGTGSEPSARIRGMVASDEPPPPVRTVAPGETIFTLFERTAALFPAKPALQVRREGRWVRYTYDEALRATGTIMRRFLEHGLLPGDRVAICAENGPEWGLAYLAVMRAAMTAVPLDPQLLPLEAWSAARFAGARLLCAGASTFDDLARHRGPNDAELVKLREPFIPPPGASRDPEPDPMAVDDSAIASILFTSGTTIAPKAVPLTHRNFLANASALLRVHPILPADELLSLLPLYHAFEFTGGFLVPMLCGATVTYVDQLKSADILTAMQATGTTIMLTVPRFLKMFHDSIESGVASGGMLRRWLFRTLGPLSDLTGHRLGRRFFAPVHKKFGGRLRMFVSGASALDPELLRAYARMGFVIYEGYGLTETAPVLTVSPPGSAKPASVGPPLPNVELTIRNQNLEGIGEVWARGPSVMSGYLNDPESTAEVMVDGWLRTGDLGKRDEDGFLFLTGRSKDLIITGAGKNVYPDEVEVRYKDVPYAKDLCVFGLPADDGIGDTVHAVVVVDEAAAAELDRSSIEREIRLAAETIGQALPTHQRITALHFWYRDLPKTSTLKAKRGVIRDVVAASVGAGEGAVTELRGSAAGARGNEEIPEAFAALRRILSKHSKRPENAIHHDTHLLLDLGIDSIGKVDLIGTIEAQFSMRIDDKKAAAIARVSDLLHIIGDRKPMAGATRGKAWRRLVAANDGGGAGGVRASAGLGAARWLVRGAVSAFLNTYIRVEVRGREHIPTAGPFILAPNHCSHLDSPCVVTAVGTRRRVWVAGAEDYFFNTPLKRFVFGKLLDTIAFDRHADGLSGLRRCSEALVRGDGLLLFPEGTRSLNGRMQPFKVGVAVLAMERRVPIVPVHIDRTYELWPKGRRLVRPGVVKVQFGAAVQPPDNDSAADHYAALQELTRRVQDAVEALARGA